VFSAGRELTDIGKEAKAEVDKEVDEAEKIAGAGGDPCAVV